jgi:hypothetical protein
MVQAATLGLALALAAAPALAETFTETFDGGSNVGGWTFGTGNEVIEAGGGNPGAYLHDTFVDTFAPQPRTSQPSIFTGDLRQLGVSRIGIDLITFSVDFSAEGRPLTLMLISDQGTPANFDDDWAAYFMGPSNIPLPGEGWISYSFDVPSQETSLPAGWATVAFGPSSPPEPDWNQVITNVAELRFFYGDPTMFFIFQGWNLGLDNPTISYGLFEDGFESGDTSAWSATMP